jgi:hypothetical protein
MANVTQADIIPDLGSSRPGRADAGGRQSVASEETQKNGQSVDCPFFLKMACAVDVLDR